MELKTIQITHKKAGKEKRDHKTKGTNINNKMVNLNPNTPSKYIIRSLNITI